MSKIQIASGVDHPEWGGGPNVIVHIVESGQDIALEPDEAEMVALQLRRYSSAAKARRMGVSVPVMAEEEMRLEERLVSTLKDIRPVFRGAYHLTPAVMARALKTIDEALAAAGPVPPEETVQP